MTNENTAITTVTGGAVSPVGALATSDNPARIHLATVGSSSRQTILHDLGVLAALLAGDEPGELTKAERETLVDSIPWAALQADQVTAIRGWLADAYATTTANRMLSALRGVLRQARRLVRRATQEAQTHAGDANTAMCVALASQAIQDALQDAIDAAEMLPGDDTTSQAERGRALHFGKIMAMMNVCAVDPGPARVRDAAIVALLRVAGLRRAEVSGLDVASFDAGAQRLTVRGKRNKTRSIPIEDPGALGALGALADWLHLRGQEPGPLFTRIDRVAGSQHAFTHERLTDQAIYYILNERRQQAGVEPFIPHDLRRTLAGDLLDAGTDVVTAQKLMGHSNAQTTAGYDRRGEEPKRKAVQALGAPYTRRCRNGKGRAL